MYLQPFIIRNTFRFLRGIIVLCCFYARSGHAQQADTAGIIKEYLQLGSAYQQRPLYLEIEQHNTTNFITGSEDTARTRGRFYLLPGASYIRFGDIEQLVIDSVALLVSNNLQQMILFRDAQPILQQMQAYTGLAQLDTSVQRLIEKFTVHQTGKDTSVMLLTSKRNLPGTALPYEMMELHYDSKQRVPVKMISIKRSLVPLDAGDYQQLKKDPMLAGSLITRDDKAYYLVREQAITLAYTHIDHNPSLQLPVALSDRIRKNGHGQFEPARTYEHYQLTIN